MGFILPARRGRSKNVAIGREVQCTGGDYRTGYGPFCGVIVDGPHHRAGKNHCTESTTWCVEKKTPAAGGVKRVWIAEKNLAVL